MTRDEREQEAQRLMASLDGAGEAMLITEDGAVGAVPGDVEEQCCCPHCFVFIDSSEVGVEGVEIDGEVYCHECAPIAEKMNRAQCACPFCEGKRLIFAPMRAEEKPTWQNCPMCRGQGWTTWLQAERSYPGSLWPPVDA